MLRNRYTSSLTKPCHNIIRERNSTITSLRTSGRIEGKENLGSTESFRKAWNGKSRSGPTTFTLFPRRTPTRSPLAQHSRGRACAPWAAARSEERRVGKEGRAGWSPGRQEKVTETE